MICNGFAQACVVIDVLTDVWVEEVIKIFAGVFVINVRTAVVIDMFSAAWLDVTIDVVSDIGVEVLTDVNTNVLVVEMIDL